MTFFTNIYKCKFSNQDDSQYIEIRSFDFDEAAEDFAEHAYYNDYHDMEGFIKRNDWYGDKSIDVMNKDGVVKRFKVAISFDPLFHAMPVENQATPVENQASPMNSQTTPEENQATPMEDQSCQ